VPGGAKFKVKIPARLYNRGYGVAAPQRVDLYHDGEIVQSDRIVIGPPGGSRFLAKRFAVEAKVDAGGAAVSSVGLLLDPDDDVVEYDERNNWDGFFYYVLDDSCAGGWPTCGVPSAPNGQSRPERPDGESPEASEVCLGPNAEVPDSPGLEISSDVNGLGTFAFETDPPESLEQTFYIRNTGNTSVQNIVVLSSDGVPIPGVPSSLAAGAQVEVTRTLPELDAKVATQMLATVSGTTADGYGVGATSTITRAVPIQGFADLESEPIIFVPGMAGSRIDGPGLDPKNYWPDVGLGPNKHRSLTLDEDSSHFESGLYATAPLETVAVFDVYGKFITALENGSAPGQERRPRFPNDRIIDRECPTPGGEGQNSVGSSKLFVFPYDWRRSNADHVEHLDWLVDCVANLHPDLRIHMVGHSMGGLLARRYAMEHPGRISKVVTIGTPWLGAPKVLMTLLTGDFLGWVQSFIITEEDLRFVAQSTPGPHELMPSRAYFEELGGRPFKDLGRSYDYPDYAFIHDQVLNRRFRPASTMEAFHDFENAGSHQDDWRKERTFAEYFHVYGVKDGPPSTIESIILQDDVVPLLEAETGLEIQSDVAATAAVASDAELSNVGQAVIRRVDRVMGQGDGTVPLLSATRRTPLTQFPQANLNGKGAWLWRPPETSDQDHNGMLKNPAVHQFIIKVLDPDPDTPLPAGLEPAVP
jgi:pimeloyl-ACP methyl ester carboxylesterase